MAKKKSEFTLKGELIYEHGQFYVSEVKKESEDTYDLTKELVLYDGKNISITVTEEIELEPIDK